MHEIQRRAFLKTGSQAVAGGALAVSMPLDSRAEEEKKATVVVVHGTDLPKMVEAGIAKMGGWDAFFKAGIKVAIKPNVAWNSTPEQGANTHPDIVKTFVLAAEARKVKQITIPENTCAPEDQSFPASGVPEAIKGTIAKLYRPNAKKSEYVSVDIPNGKICKKAMVTRDLVEADCLINMPVAKHHSGATLTLSMKNWMGAVDNRTRQSWHREGLHQCIADFSTFLKPKLVVIDATRILLDHGPQGPGKLAHPHEIIFSTDPVAADAYASTLFGKKPEEIPHIRIAGEMGIGCMDLAKITIDRVEI